MLCGCDVTFGRSRMYVSSLKVAIIPTIFTENRKICGDLLGKSDLREFISTTCS